MEKRINKKFIFLILVLAFFVSLGFLNNGFAEAETSPDGCVTWDTYISEPSCVGLPATADLSWNSLAQVDIDEIRSDCTLQSVNYTVEIIGLGSVEVGGSTNYSWGDLSSGTFYQWKAISNYQCTVPYRSGSISTEVFSFTTPICNSSPGKPGIPIEYQPNGVSWDNCVFQLVSLPTFHWTYSDPDSDPQIAYEIRIDNDSDFSVIDGDEYQCGGSVCSGGASIAYTPVSADWSDWMDWNRAYWWIARVQDSYSNWSEWSDANQFITPLHPYPLPDFTHEPPIPTAEEEVLFIDSSVCYNAGGGSYFCKDNVNNRYQWDFDDDLIIDCDSNINPACRGNATTTYSESGNYLVKLYITDDLGTCDTTGDTPIVTSLPLPEYKEVPPIIWMKKALASAYIFFQTLFNF